MVQANIHEAKTHLSRLIAAAEAGEDVVISRAGKPVVRLVPVHASRPAQDFRVPNQLAGKIQLHPDFDETRSEQATRAFTDDDPQDPLAW